MNDSAQSSVASAHDTPPRPRTRRRWLPVLIGLLVGGSVMGLAGAGYLLLPDLLDSRGSGSVAEVVGGKLPGNTSLVGQSPLYEDDVFVEPPTQFVASELAATICGKTNVADLLERAYGKDPEYLAISGIFDLSTTGPVADAVRCGEYVRGLLTRPEVVTLMFSEEERLGAVQVFWSRMEDFPGQIVRHNFSGLPGFCEPVPDGDECAPGGRAGVHDGPMWAVGGIDAVQAFARAHTSAAEDATTNVEILRTLADGLEGLDEAVLMPRPESVLWTAPCNRIAPVGRANELAEHCFPPRQERVTESIETKLRGLSLERNRLATGWAIHWVFGLLARDEDSAEEIERDLSDLLRDWRAHLANSEPAMVRMFQEESSFVHDALWREALPAFVRAIQQAEIERDGSMVRLRIQADLTEAEVQLVREQMETRTEIRDATARIVDAIIQQERLPEESLAVFVGEELASYVASPRATAEDCRHLRTKLAGLTGGDLAPELFGLKLGLEQALADERCVSSPLPEEVKTCHLQAQDLAAFETCRQGLPRSPEEVRLLAKLRGQWEQTDFRFFGNWQLRRLFDGARLELTDEQAALRLGDLGVGVAPLALEVESADQAEIQVRLPEGDPIRARVSVLDESQIAVSFDGSAVVFTRADWHDSLLARGGAQ